MLQQKKIHVKIGDLVTVISGFNKKKPVKSLKLIKKQAK